VYAISGRIRPIIPKQFKTVDKTYVIGDAGRLQPSMEAKKE